MSSTEMYNRKCKPLTAMWQVDVPQIIAMREAIGWSSQGKWKPFTSAPITPGTSKITDLLFLAEEKLYCHNEVFWYYLL